MQDQIDISPEAADLLRAHGYKHLRLLLSAETCDGLSGVFGPCEVLPSDLSIDLGLGHTLQVARHDLVVLGARSIQLRACDGRVYMDASAGSCGCGMSYS